MPTKPETDLNCKTTEFGCCLDEKTAGIKPNSNQSIKKIDVFLLTFFSHWTQLWWLRHALRADHVRLLR